MPATTAPKAPHTGGKRAKSYDVALELQTLLLNDCRAKTTKPAVRAVCARTWDILEERKRVLRRVPLPKSVDVERLKEQRRAARAAKRTVEPSFVEQPEPPAAA